MRLWIAGPLKESSLSPRLSPHESLLRSANGDLWSRTLNSKPLTVDSSHAPSYATVPPSPPPSAGLDAPDQLTVAMAGKPGRSGAPPRIDPSIASMSPP